MLELQNICYRVSTPEGELDILRDISITIPDQRLMVFTGPNGGGKTTLAKIIMGLVQPTSGRILYNGQDVTPLSITDRARLGISYGFQQPPRFKGITVHDLLRLAAGRDKLTKDQCCAYLTKVGLCANDYLDREVDVSLSGGEVKRIEIATILARRGSLMIFDEPEAGIDLWSFARLTETFEQIHREHQAAMIIISHQERIIQLADEIAVIPGGRPKPGEPLPSLLKDRPKPVRDEEPKEDPWALPQLFADEVYGDKKPETARTPESGEKKKRPRRRSRGHGGKKPADGQTAPKAEQLSQEGAKSKGQQRQKSQPNRKSGARKPGDKPAGENAERSRAKAQPPKPAEGTTPNGEKRADGHRRRHRGGRGRNKSTTPGAAASGTPAAE